MFFIKKVLDVALMMSKRWLMRENARANVERPGTVQELQSLIASAGIEGRTVVTDSAWRIYDAVNNENTMILDLSLLREVNWNPEQEIIQVQPGVTIDKLWRTVIGNGKWPEVLASWLEASIADCLAVNTSGSNGWYAGSLGEHVQSFDLILPSGELVTVTPWDNTDLFHSAIGGLGMLGVIASITLHLRRIRSGKLLVRERSVNSFAEMFEVFAEESPNEGYLIGHINTRAREDATGSGVVLCGYLPQEADLNSLRPHKQGVPASIVRFVSSSIFSRTLQPMIDWNVNVRNHLLTGRNIFNGNGNTRYLPIAQFHFPFSFMKYSLRSLISKRSYVFHPFVPGMEAQRVFNNLLQLSHRSGFVPLWGIMRKHRADQFVLSCHVNGFSLELAYCPKPSDEIRLVALLQEMLNRVIEAGGRLSLAQDRILDASTFERMMPRDTITSFRDLKRHYDRDNIFQPQLFRRLFG